VEKALQVSLIKELTRQIDNKVNVDAGVMMKTPTSVYTCTDLAEKEWRHFFQGHPQLIGLSGELPVPGSYLTTEDFGVPVLVTRDEDGRCHAFVNACRHRGVRVALEERGEKTRFACPFHRWTYDARGALVAIPQEDHFGAVDKSCHGLIELPMEERYGLLWLHPQPDGALDLDLLLGDLAAELKSWKLHNLVYAGNSTIDMRLNWKLANDTFGETYHFQKLHKDTLGQLFYGDVLAYETFGRNHRFVIANKRIDHVRTLPEEEQRIAHAASTIYYLFPNIQLIIGMGSISLVKIYPAPGDPGRSITRVAHYFTPNAIAAAAQIGGHGEDVSRETVYQRDENDTGIPSLQAFNEVFDSTIEKEDYAMGELAQKSAENGLLDHLIFGRNEPALHHYHNTFRAALNMPPLEEFAG
jgi:phenylpropionate dioxygenase-like ring-hydroxylating dioxygenase large terminal subunit